MQEKRAEHAVPHRPPPYDAMKNRLLVIAILISAVLLVLDAGLRSDLFSSRISPVVAAYIQKNLGQEVVIGGIHASLLPPTLEIRDLYLPMNDRITTLAGVRKARAYLNPLPLLWKRISITSIVLLEPRFFIETTAKGPTEALSLMRESFRELGRGERAQERTSLVVVVHTVTIRNALVVYQDVDAHSRYTVQKLNARAHIDAIDAPSIRLTVQHADVSIITPAVSDLTFAVKMSGGYRSGKLYVDSFSARSRGSWLDVSGYADFAEHGAIDLKLRMRIEAASIEKTTGPALTRKRKNPYVEISSRIEGTIPEPSVKGSMKVGDLVVQGIELKNAHLDFAYHESTLSIEGDGWNLVRGKTAVMIGEIRAGLAYREAGVDILGVVFRGEELTSSLSGRIDFRTGYDVTVSIELTGSHGILSDVSRVPLSGKIGLDGKISGPLAEPRFTGGLAAGPMTIRSIPFEQVRGNLEYSGKTITVADCEIRQQTSRYSLSGSVDLKGKNPVFDARLDVIRSDVKNVVALFYRELPLEIVARGELTFHGSPGDYSGSGFVTADGGTAYGESFVNGAVKITLSTGMITFDQVVAYKGNGIVKGQGWIAFMGSYSASIQSRHVDLAEVDYIRFLKVSGPFKLDLDSSGTFREFTLDSTLDVERLSYDATPVGPAGVHLTISDHVLKLRGTVPDGRADLAAQLKVIKPYDWSVSLSTQAEHIDPFQLSGMKDLAGRMQADITGNVHANGRGKNLAMISGTASIPRLKLVLGEYWIENERPVGIALNEGNMRITTLDMRGPETSITLSGSTSLGRDMDVNLRGTMNLSLLRILFKEVENGDGLIELNLSARESWVAPEISGSIGAREGMIKVKDIPQKFMAINGKASFSRGRIVVDSLKSRFGGGSLDVGGWIQLDGLKLRDFSLRTSGSDVTVRYPEGVVSNLSGDLYYEGTAAEQQLSGEIEIRKAIYEKRLEWKTMLLELARGIYQKKKAETGWIGNTMLNIRFRGKESVLLQNNLAKMPLNVDLQLRGTINALQLIGRVEARKGVVYFRKNDFTILHASADFIDPTRLNPVLDIQAETRVREYLIRLAVTGTAERSVISFMSEPALSDPDILGVLALGKTGSELKGKEAGVGMGEAVSFATGQFQDIFERRARSLTGLDRFQVDPYVGKSDTSVPRVTVGKEIVKDRLFVTYSSNVGASSPEPVLKLEYILNRNFSVVGEQNELGKIGADVKFRFEFK